MCLLQAVAMGMWTVLEVVLLGALLMYASVSIVTFLLLNLHIILRYIFLLLSSHATECFAKINRTLLKAPCD